MTPREATQEETRSATTPFTLRELVLHGRPNWPGTVFFAGVAVLHIYVAIHSFETSFWECAISAGLAGCFLMVALLCGLARSEIAIRPRQQLIHLHGGVGRLAIDRDKPFSAVRAVRVTLWQSRRGPKSRVEILCDGEEIPCPPTAIPRQQALYLALVMNVRLIKICDEGLGNAMTSSRETSNRC